MRVYPQDDWTLSLLKLHAYIWKVIYDDETEEGFDDEDNNFVIKLFIQVNLALDGNPSFSTISGYNNNGPHSF